MSDAQQTASFDALFRLMRAKIDNFDTRRSLKSAQLANESKGRGNELLKARKFEKALDFYNKVSYCYCFDKSRFQPESVSVSRHCETVQSLQKSNSR